MQIEKGKENQATLDLETVRKERLRYLLTEGKISTEATQPNNEDENTTINDYAVDNSTFDEYVDLGGDDETIEEFEAKLKVMEQREDELMALGMALAGEDVARCRQLAEEEEAADRLAFSGYRGEPRRMRRPQPVEVPEFVPNMRMISEQNAALIAEVHALLNNEEPASRRRYRSQTNLAELMAELNAMPNEGHGPSMPRGPVFCMSLHDFIFVPDENSRDEGEEEDEQDLPAPAQGDRAENILFFPDYSIYMNEEEDEEERIATNNFNAALDNFFNMRTAEGRPSVTLGRDLHNFLLFLDEGQ